MGQSFGVHLLNEISCAPAPASITSWYVYSLMPTPRHSSLSVGLKSSKHTRLLMVRARPSFFIYMTFLTYSIVVKMVLSSVYSRMKSTACTPIESKKPMVVYVMYMLAMWVVVHSHLFLAQIPVNSQSLPSPYVYVTKLSFRMPLATFWQIVSTCL